MNKDLNLDSFDNFGDFIKILLFELAEKCESRKDFYLRNALAKTASLIESIFKLHQIGNYYDGWILYRSLSGRLAHILYLDKNNSYLDFEKWTFIRDFEDNNRARSDPKFKRNLLDSNFDIDDTQKLKYSNYKSDNPKWKRPKVENILVENELDFLYKYGYDYASKHTHPMYNDGSYEFYKLTGLEPNPYANFSKTALIINRLLLATMITQTCLNFLTFKFRTIMYNYIESIRNSLDGDDKSFKINFIKIDKLFEEKISLCE